LKRSGARVKAVATDIGLGSHFLAEYFVIDVYSNYGVALGCIPAVLLRQ
jgi:hypothetical protein